MIDLSMIDKIMKINPDILIKRLKKSKDRILPTMGLILLYGSLSFLKNEIEETIKEEENTVDIERRKSDEI